MSKDKYEGLRIYTVVPGTVQTPIMVTYNHGKTDAERVYSFGRMSNTRDIVQPAGRQAQQVGHVARMVEHWRVFQELNKHFYTTKGRFSKHLSTDIPYAPITGITKSCRDSFELLHVKQLLDAKGIKYFEFRDTQEDLYEDVVTALATVPVTPFDINGALDYLPLWSGK